MSVKEIYGGEKPDWYGEITYAWFPKDHACQKHNIPSFEGWISLMEAMDDYPNTDITDWEILSVDDVEECTINWPYDDAEYGLDPLTTIPDSV